MNSRLLIGALVVILFIIVLIVPHYKKKEDFTILYKIPNKIISNHVDFINSKSNQYSSIFNLFDVISNEVFNIYKNDDLKELTVDSINQTIYDIVYKKLKDIANSASHVIKITKVMSVKCLLLLFNISKMKYNQ